MQHLRRQHLRSRLASTYYASVCTLLFSAIFLLLPIAASTQAVNIPDPNLRAAIANHLEKAPGAAITHTEMETLREFRADNQGIRDLRGLETAINLERIELRNNEITDLTPLAGLIRLHNLKLRGNAISSVTPLADLMRVHWMGLEENRITNFSPLARIPRLDELGISGNPVSSLASLSRLTNLVGLRVNDTTVQDLSPLRGLTNLRWLEIRHSLISDLSPLAGLTGLRRLDFRHNLIDDLSPLAGLPNLVELEISHNLISDLSPLANLSELAHLSITENAVSDLSPLASLSKLQGFGSWGNPISDLSPFSGLTQLRYLNICGGSLPDLSSLAGLTGLTELYLVNNGISDVSPLAGLRNLTYLDLHHNDISDFSSLEALPETTRIRKEENPGFSAGDAVHNYDGSPPGGPKITGPWLWLLVPGDWLGDKDLLAEVSRGAVTERKVATFGATEGKAVGGGKWRAHTLSATSDNNINEMTDALGWGSGWEIYDHVVYGSLSLQSPRRQETTMLVGSDDAVKVWLNGELVHRALVGRGADDYQDFFPVTLKLGTNVLLVAVDNRGHGHFSGFFGFEAGTDYTVNATDRRIFVSVPAWDVNKDAKVSVLDMIVVAQALGQPKNSRNSRADVNGDGTINILDLQLVAQHRETLPGAAAPMGVRREDTVSAALIRSWIAEAQAVHDGSLLFEQGIANLRQLLAEILPEKTRLLANYPNPFNPETWIPYQLAQATRVQIRIYASSGKLVRTLDLGHRAAGHYQQKSRAAYWDGRNQLGEAVASGVYFYTLSTADFTGTGKMLIRK